LELNDIGKRSIDSCRQHTAGVDPTMASAASTAVGSIPTHYHTTTPKWQAQLKAVGSIQPIKYGKRSGKSSRQHTTGDEQHSTN
jgi:hypothetical protein